ncbi:MAG: DUF4304 domain-containing protein [Phycisphaerales bacterium]
MTGREINSHFAVVARQHGYRRMGGRWWRSDQEITTLVELQASKWGSTIYVNVGVLPTCFAGPAPPRSGYWALSGRPPRIKADFAVWFGLLEGNGPDQLTPHDASLSIDSLFRWIDKHLADSQLLRIEANQVGTWTWEHARAMLKDWIRGQLRPAADYELPSRPASGA